MPPWTAPAAAEADTIASTAMSPTGATEYPSDSPEPVETASSESTDELPDPAAFDLESDGAASSIPLRQWRAALDEHLNSATSSLLDAFQAVQTQADADAVFVRGEAAWRKHLSLLNDSVDEAVHRGLEALATQVSRHADAAIEAMSEGLARAKLTAKQALARQGDMYQDKLRRTRGALKKEMDRFATLETCLRAEQARQREALHEQHIRGITEAHRDREEHLHATLRDLRAAYSNVETANEQLLEALRASRREAEQLKNSLVASRSGGGGTRHASRRESSSVLASMSTSPGRASGDSAVLKGMLLTASELVEQNLRQSLVTANKELASAKQQVIELEREQRASDKREQQAQEQTAKAQSELMRATGLLVGAQAGLVAGKERVGELELERERWREDQRELQFRLEVAMRRCDGLERVDEAKREYVAELERQQRRLEQRNNRCRVIEDLLVEWQTHGDAVALLEQITATLMDDSEHGDGGEASDRTACEMKLRFEMEKRFGDQLGLRVAHERKRVLARLEVLCGREQSIDGVVLDLSVLLSSPSRLDSAGKERRKRLQAGKGSGRADTGRTAFQLLSRVVRQAYEDLGVCVGEWSETDLDALLGRIQALEQEVSARDEQLTDVRTQLEVQRLALKRSELVQSEKDALVAELTDRCRQLRVALEGATAAVKDEETAPSMVSLHRQPLTVYGVTQPIESKRTRRAMSLAASPAQTRPLSAAPVLSVFASPSSSKVPAPSRLGALAPGFTTGKAAMDGRWTEAGREEEDERDVPEHIRSVLKSQLMQSEPSNQQDGVARTRVSPPPALGSEGTRASKTLLVEAGPSDRCKWDVWKLHSSAALTYDLGESKYNRTYYMEPQAWTTSSYSYLNALAYTRGDAYDYYTTTGRRAAPIN